MSEQPATTRSNKSITYATITATTAILISIVSAAISFTQLATVREQLKMNQLQIRPYVRWRPIFDENGRDQLHVSMVMENLSPIPARTIYTQLKTWVDESTTDAFMYNHSGEILYQNKDGANGLPPMPKAIAKDAIAGKVKLTIGTCVVYGTISPADLRRWEVRAIYAYAPGHTSPVVEYLTEVDVAGTADHCDTSTIRAEWLDKKGKPRELSTSGTR
jgi:hypothetical protein